MRRHLAAALLYAAASLCAGQAHSALCSGGFGSFASKPVAGITVTVGATRSGGFARHFCAATLEAGRTELPVAAKAAQIDIDVLNADLGLGMPVVAFDIRAADSDRLRTYSIYSLDKRPRLLRTLTGGSFYDARDTRLANRIEIWTDDAGVADHFENIPLASFDYLPPVVLRFEKGRLIDVGAEFSEEFDRRIGGLREHLDPQGMSGFKQSDGRLEAVQPGDLAGLHGMLRAKIAALEMVWSYLNSGRETQAWETLRALWPAADLERIRGAIVDARARGMRRQVDEVASAGAAGRWNHHAHVLDMTREVKSQSGVLQGTQVEMAASGLGGAHDPEDDNTASLPEAIWLDVPFSQANAEALSKAKIYVNLVIDAAGKVHTAELSDRADASRGGEAVIAASSGWRFSPARKDGRAVAARVRLGVWPYR